MKQHKQNCSKVRWGIFSFFSSTNVETKNVCPIAYNALQPCDSWLLRRLAALDSQFCKGAVIGWLRYYKHKTQIEALKKIIKNSEAWAKNLNT